MTPQSNGTVSQLPDSMLPGANRCVKRSLILVVDDHFATRKVLSCMLDLQGYQPECVSNGQEALEWMERALQTKQYPAIILLDLLMPVMDGATFLMHLRMRWPVSLPFPPVILFTVDHTDHSSLGCTDVLLKPFHIRNLLEKINEILVVEDEKNDHYLYTVATMPERSGMSGVTTACHSAGLSRKADTSFV